MGGDLACACRHSHTMWIVGAARGQFEVGRTGVSPDYGRPWRGFGQAPALDFREVSPKLMRRTGLVTYRLAYRAKAHAINTEDATHIFAPRQLIGGRYTLGP